MHKALHSEGPKTQWLTRWTAKIVVSAFELQQCYLIHFQTNTFRKGIKLFIAPSYGLNDHYCSFLNMDLEFYNPRSLICY